MAMATSLPRPARPAGLRRRQALAWAGAAAALVALPGCAELGAARLRLSAQELEQALATRFPRRYPLVPRLLELELLAPRVRLLPESDQLNAVLDVQASGALLGGRRPRGVLDVDLGLRYEPADHSIRSERVQLNLLRLEELPPAVAEQLLRYGAPLAEQALSDVALYRLRPEDVARTESLGVPRIRVTANALVVEFEPRPPR